MKRTKSGDHATFDQNGEKVKEHSGFLPTERVHTPRGYGTVIGWNEGHVWVHVDGDRGASFWDDCRGPTDFERKDIFLVDKENKPLKKAPIKKFLVQYESSSKVAKLEVPYRVEEFIETLKKHLNINDEDTDDIQSCSSASSDERTSSITSSPQMSIASPKTSLKVKYFAAESDEFVALDSMYNLKNEKTLKVKVERVKIGSTPMSSPLNTPTSISLLNTPSSVHQPKLLNHSSDDI